VVGGESEGGEEVSWDCYFLGRRKGKELVRILRVLRRFGSFF